MALLENPALSLSIGMQDILGILEATLREKNWKNFELANLKLVYEPYYIFNYDLLVEQEVQGQTFSQGTSGIMAMNAINGKLEPVLTQILEEQPVSYEKEISHDMQYELDSASITKEEVPAAGKIKLAAQFSTKRDAVSISGIRLVYWPVWRIFVTLPRKTQRLDIEAVSGYTLNSEEVPTREKGWIEVTQDTLASLKTAKGWAEMSKKAAGATAAGMRTAVSKEKKEGSRSSGAAYWLLHTKVGQYTLILLILLVIVMLVAGGGSQSLGLK
jgi:hypothetical protein